MSLRGTLEVWYLTVEVRQSMKLPPEARQCAEVLRAILSCRLIIMAAYHYAASLMKYLQSPPDAGPTVVGRAMKKGRKGSQRREINSAFRSSDGKKGHNCNYEHQVDADGKPILVGPEFLQRYDEAVKRLNDNKAQNKAKVASEGGVGVSSATTGKDRMSVKLLCPAPQYKSLKIVTRWWTPALMPLLFHFNQTYVEKLPNVKSQVHWFMDLLCKL